MTDTILIVDPHVDVAEVLRTGIESVGYEAATASGIAGAMAHAERIRPSLAVVNLSLPDGDGFRLLRLLKSRDPSLEVILMTGGGSSSAEVVEAIEEGAFHFLFKPFDLEELRVAVEGALEHRRFLAERPDRTRKPEELEHRGRG